MAEVDLLSDANRRMRPHLSEMVKRYVQDIDGDAAADILSQPNHPEHEKLYGQLEDAMSEAASGHAPGLPQSEQGDWYKLGKGDQQVYSRLRDHNLMAAAAGRQPLAHPSELQDLPEERGKPIEYAPGPQGWGAAPSHGPSIITSGAGITRNDLDRNRAGHLMEAADRYEHSGNDPEHHSSVAGTYYPQHAILGHQTGANPAALWGDTVIGNTLSSFNTWTDGSARASRRDEKPLLSGGPDVPFMPSAATRAAANAVSQGYKWGKNILSGLNDSFSYETAKTEANRGSPTVPDGLTDYERGAFIRGRDDDLSLSAVPDVKDYGHSQGVTYSPAQAWLYDMGHEFFDPFTTVSLGGGVLHGLLKSGLKSLPKAAGAAAVREAYEEGSSPLNYAMAASFPLERLDAEAVKNAFTTPDKSTIPAGAAQNYSDQEREADEALRRLRSANQQTAPARPAYQSSVLAAGPR